MLLDVGYLTSSDLMSFVLCSVSIVVLMAVREEKKKGIDNTVV